MSDRETIRVYDQRASEYADVTSSKSPDKTLKSFMNALPKGGKVLDLGCGPGLAAGYMAAQGFDVEAWDASAEMVALASKQPEVKTRQAVFADLAAVDVYDGIWANFSLLHAPRDQMPEHLAAIQCALKPKGLFHIALKEGDGHKRDSLGRQYNYYTVETLSALLQDAGLTPGPYRTGVDMGLDGMPAAWISTTAYA
ncbi:MAG: class I SAM-dependent DNA methyltransferase [Pelagimonas sp.]|uniref:class I SAM-dependent DNA methyltransferase n=1 Tax=Pelagimonas sp. TaxID=2073170 RepID=UPI003D6B5AD4